MPKLTPSIAKLEGPKHITMTDKVTQARAQLAWPTVVRGHLDESSLAVLAAVLGGLPKENRLYRTLVFDKQLAVRTVTLSYLNELAGTFHVMITAKPGQKLDELVKIADEEIKHSRRRGQPRRKSSRPKTETRLN